MDSWQILLLWNHFPSQEMCQLHADYFQNPNVFLDWWSHTTSKTSWLSKAKIKAILCISENIHISIEHSISTRTHGTKIRRHVSWHSITTQLGSCNSSLKVYWNFHSPRQWIKYDWSTMWPCLKKWKKSQSSTQKDGCCIRSRSLLHVSWES